MANNRDIQKRASAEIDSASPGSRLPRLADIDSMPYVLAIIKETLRWNPSLSLGQFFVFMTVGLYLRLILGIAHCSRKEDTYNGTFMILSSNQVICLS
jgi:hypothetical protein